MSCKQITEEARFGPLRSQNESKLSSLTISGRSSLFDQCPLETQLATFVSTRESTDAAAIDTCIQEKAADIITDMVNVSQAPSSIVANWLVELIYTKSDWLQSFKARTGSLQRILNVPLGLNEDHSLADFPQSMPSQVSGTTMNPPMCEINSFSVHGDSAAYRWTQNWGGLSDTSLDKSPGQHHPLYPKRTRMFFNSATFFSSLVRDLARWAAATMSPKNPTCHVPTDEELQHQARCIVYNE